jgi:hypothetical protein
VNKNRRQEEYENIKRNKKEERQRTEDMKEMGRIIERNK